MNASDFIPVYGSYTSTRDVIHDYDEGDISFSEAAFRSIGVGMFSGASTIVLSELFGFSKGTVALARFGASAAPVVPYVAAAVVSTYVATEYVAPHMGSALQDALAPTTGVGSPQTMPSWMAVPMFFVGLVS